MKFSIIINHKKMGGGGGGETAPRSNLYGPNLSLHTFCNLRLTDRTWAEFKKIVTQNHHLLLPGLTKLKEYKKLTYLEQVKYTETEVKCSLFNMIKHSVSRVFEYLLDDEDNSIKFLAQEERDNIYVICKVGGDGQSDQTEFQNAATMKEVWMIPLCIVKCFYCSRFEVEKRYYRKIVIQKVQCNPSSCFVKETASFNQEKIEHLKNKILSLENIKFTLHDYTFVINSSLSTIYTTMNDGKTLNAVVSKML